jgi:transcriptional regulator with XRE-family HTH domain
MTKYDAVELAFELGADLRRLREKRGWSQSSLAEAARTTQPVVARLEVGGAVPTVAVLQRLARAMEVRLEVRFRATEEISSPTAPAPRATSGAATSGAATSGAATSGAGAATATSEAGTAVTATATPRTSARARTAVRATATVPAVTTARTTTKDEGA